MLSRGFDFNFVMSLQVPGFRPGKNVPESILISYVGKDTVKRATIESILKRTLPHALSSVSLHLLVSISLYPSQIIEWLYWNDGICLVYMQSILLVLS